MRIKKSTLLVVAFIATTFLSQCKKGEDDPFLSLQSRKARVVGSWTLKSGTSNYKYSEEGYFYTYNITYSETSYTDLSTEDYSGHSSSNTGNGTHSLKVNFNKDGKFKWEEIQDGQSEVVEGTWNFTGGIGGKKNKTQLVLHASSDNYANGSSTFQGNQTDRTYGIKELRSKKIVLVAESSSQTSDSGDDSSDETKTEFNFEQ